MLEEKIRKFVSKKALDFSENLPEFQGGAIHRMQRIRAMERKIATENAISTKCPDDVTIKLESISMFFVYEFENFEAVHASLQKLFPKNKKIAQIINGIRDRQNDINGASWSEIGLVTMDSKEHYIIDKVEKALPDHVSGILISHFRLLPSLACLQFRVIPSDDFKLSLSRLAEQTYINHTVSNSIIPSKLFKGNKGKLENVAAAVVSDKIRSIVKVTNKWLMKELSISAKNVDESSAHPLYKIIHDLPINVEEFSKKHGAWLSKYGFSPSSYYSYYSDTAIFSPSLSDSERSHRLEPLFYVDRKEDQFGVDVDGLLRGAMSSSVLLSRLFIYKSMIEGLRSKGLMDLTSKWKVIKNSGETLYKLKHVLLRLDRMLMEAERLKPWLYHSFDSANVMSKKFNGKTSTLPSDIIDIVNGELIALKESAVILDKALSDRLATENIYAMYQLQRKVFYLTIVAVIIAGVGLISIWDKLSSFIKPILILS
ncbi:hypothetical protein OB959_22420 [Aeromonas bestiarum]|uniref:Uncharacterized protein n=1 Tax=Aeromonas bestiarum TaxID=105751 RepID=A0AAW7I3X6_9GAMM|nr:hypothetical protein [Aeromonas bestiarum]MDM5142511.1 hypothetical protein [Aeromonas bestiarum]